MGTSAGQAEQLSLFESARPPGSRSERPLAPPPPQLLGEAIDLYCQCLVASARPTHTVQSTAYDLRGLIEQLGDVPIANITAGQLQTHIRWLRLERRNGSASLRRKIATFKTFFRFVVASGWLTEDPAAPLIYPPSQRAPIVALDATEVAKVVEAGAHDAAWHALVLLLLDAGLKRDEVLALRADDLYLAREPADSRVSVRHAAEAKRVRHRSIPLTARAHFAVARLLQAPLPGGPLFELSVRGVNFVIETVGRRAGITRLRKLTPEILRDTFAVRFMHEQMEAERLAAERGAGALELGHLRPKHDEEVLKLLGLSRYSDMAARYRAAVNPRSVGGQSATAAKSRQDRGSSAFSEPESGTLAGHMLTVDNATSPCPTSKTQPTPRR